MSNKLLRAFLQWNNFPTFWVRRSVETKIPTAILQCSVLEFIGGVKINVSQVLSKVGLLIKRPDLRHKHFSHRTKKRIQFA